MSRDPAGCRDHLASRAASLCEGNKPPQSTRRNLTQRGRFVKGEKHKVWWFLPRHVQDVVGGRRPGEGQNVLGVLSLSGTAQAHRGGVMRKSIPLEFLLPTQSGTYLQLGFSVLQRANDRA